MPKLPADSWTVSLHATRTDHTPFGTGVVIDRHLVLTCEHVLRVDGRDRAEIWVAFPKAGVGPGVRCRARVAVTGQGQIDVAQLELADPVPGEVRPARLRCTSAADLADTGWWAFGFPDGDRHGGSASGRVGDPGGFGVVPLETSSATGLRQGFSGGALWSYDYEAVVGLIVQEWDGNGRALTLDYADELVPELKLSLLAEWRAEDADDAALAAWGWTLSRDEEARRHWLPRARGVAVHDERGSRFRGRTAALRVIKSWLDAPAAQARPLIVTGSPGVGKSAVLGRIVTTADAAVAAALTADDVAEVATAGSVTCAVHAKGKSALEVATEVARAAAAGIPAEPADLMPALRDRLSRRPARFNLVIDALDEAVSPGQVRRIISDVVEPLTRELARWGVQVVVGTRRTDDGGDLLAEFGPAAEIVDLDSGRYFAEADLSDYALATLGGVDRPGNPYRDVAVAEPVARRIAVLSRGNFLVAGLVARARALRDELPLHPDAVAFEATVADALDRYVDGLPSAGWTPARLALTALAYAETPGLPIDLWKIAVEALGGQVSAEELVYFARTSAANFLVESGGADAPTYRLFHQALNEALLAGREGEEHRLVDAWLRHGRAAGWSTASDEYLLRSLPQHAAHCGAVDELLADDDYLLYARLERLLPVVETATSAAGSARAQLLQRTPHAIGAPAAERAAIFSVVERIDRIASELRPSVEPPYTALWARTPRRPERAVLEGHSEAVYDVTALPVDGRVLLASAGEDGSVRLWNPVTSQTERILDGHADCVRGLAAVRVGAVSLLATASHDHSIKLWDPRNGQLLRTLTGHTDWIRNLCPVTVPDGRTLLVSGSDDYTVRLWDPADGALQRTLTGHTGWVTAVCRAGGLVASTGFDGTVRTWDPVTGEAVARMRGHRGWVSTLCAVDDQVASAGYDGTVRLWDPRSGRELLTLGTGAGPLTDLCTVETGDTLLLAATAEDGIIRLWDARTGDSRHPIEGYASWIRAICELPVENRRLLATAGNDGTVRLWDPTTGRKETVMDDGRLREVPALTAVPAGTGTAVAATTTDGTVRLWDPVTGDEGVELAAHGTIVTGVCALPDEETPLVAVASEDRLVRVWDAERGDLFRELKGHHERVNAVCAVGTLLASAADDLTVRVWDVPRGVTRGTLLGHAAWVTALASVRRAGRDALVSADKNGMIRLWEPEGELLWEQQGHSEAVNAVISLPYGGREVIASGSADRTVRLWSPDDLRPIGAPLSGHRAAVTGLCAVPVGNRMILASTSTDRTVRLTDPRTGRLLRTIPVHYRALSCAYVADVLVVGLDQGMLALRLH